MALPQGTIRPRLSLFVAVSIFLMFPPTFAQSTQRQSSFNIRPGTFTCKPSTLRFGKVPLGESAALAVTMTNGGSTSITVSTMTASAAGFSVSNLNLPLTLAAGQSVNLNVVFTPPISGHNFGTITFTSNASDSTLNVYGAGTTGGQLTDNPSTMDFGSVQVGSNQTLSETLTNSGTSSLTISQANLTGTGFSLSGLPLPLSLTNGQSFTFSTTFAPTSSGSASGSITVISNASNSPMILPLSGTGTAAGQLTVSPATLNFGSVTVGASSSQTGTLSATGSSVTVSSATSNNSEFVLSGTSFPLTISAGQSASFTATFTPQTSGAASATLSFLSNSAN